MKKALISVSDKHGVSAFAQALKALGYDILSTGGTLKTLQDAGIKATKVSDYTGTEEILDGRVKTLHPKIHGGLLARRDIDEDMQTLKNHAIDCIDMVVVNLYPFAKTIEREDVNEDEAIEQIDIGGPSMLRSAAKNFKSVTVITDPSDYAIVLKELNEHGDTTLETRKRLAVKVFNLTAKYDQRIAAYLGNNADFHASYQLKETLRYGENPHQEAMLYESYDKDPYSLFQAQQLHGKKLSYNNIQDANAAINILAEFSNPTAVAVKHMNPCGVGSAETIHKAYQKAHASDPISIFGGIVALNDTVNQGLANTLSETFLEIIIAPSYDEDALTILKQKKNLRLLKLDTSQKSSTKKQMVSVNGGLLIQALDDYNIKESDCEYVTTLKPSQEAMKELFFAYRVVKHVKSNAIVVSNDLQTIGVGAGQMNRVGAAEIALKQAQALGYKDNLFLASDAFFPFNDIVTLAHRYGVKAIIQPGGSLRDQDSIDLCNTLGIAMVFTRKRHFKH